MTYRICSHASPYGWTRLGRLLALVVAHTCLFVSVIAEEDRHLFAVPEGSAKKTLRQVARQGKVDILFTVPVIRGVQTNALEGQFTVAEAFKRLLLGTPLAVVHDEESNAYTIVRRPSEDIPKEPIEQDEPNNKSEMKNKQSLLKKLLNGALAATSAVGMGVANAQDSDSNTNEVFTLSPFVVDAEKNKGYIATESIIATGFAEEVYKTPINIQLVTEDFMDDLNLQTIESVASYVSGVQAIDAPVSGNITDGGLFKVRGFNTTWNTRNGVRRYALVGRENVGRVEVIKGPLSVFFGQQAPGGVVNYVSKQPSFRKENQIGFRVGTDDEFYYSLESQGPIGDSDTFAYRVMYSNNDGRGWRDFEYIDREFWYGGFLWQPTENTRVMLEAETLEETANRGRNHLVAPENYLEDWANPPAEAVQYAIDNALAVPSGPQYAKQRDENGALVLDESGNAIPVVADASNAADVLRDRWLWSSRNWENDMNAAGLSRNRTATFPVATGLGYDQNVTGPHSVLFNKSKVFNADVSHRINDTFSVRANYLLDDAFRGAMNQSQSVARGNGGLQVGGQTSDNDNWSWNLRGEVLGEFTFAGMRNKVLVGVERYYDEWRQFSNTPYAVPRTGIEYFNSFLNGYDLDAEIAGDTSQRASAPSVGSPTSTPWNPLNIRTEGWPDPASFFIDSIPPFHRKSGSTSDYWRIQENTRDGMYASWTGSAIDGRLTAVAGVRREEFRNQQVVQGTGQVQPVIDTAKNTPSIGAVFEVSDGISLFANYSESFNINFGRAVRIGPDGTDEDATPEELAVRGDPLLGDGFDLGFKFQTTDRKLVGSISYFENTRDQGQARDPAATAADPRNADGLERVTRFSPAGKVGAKGFEADLFWTPIPEYTMMFSYGYIPEIEVLDGGPDGVFDNRVGLRQRNVPEHDLSIWNRYTFTSGNFEGLQLGFGVVYASEIIVNELNAGWDGVTIDGFTKFDAMVAYQTDVFGPDARFTLSINNVFEEEYYQQAWIPGAGRRITLSTRFSF